MKIKQLIWPCLLLSTATIQGQEQDEAVEEVQEQQRDYNYNNNGRDWANNYPNCASNGQAPIDLDRSQVTTESLEDQYQKHYQNFMGSDDNVAVNDDGLMVKLPEFDDVRYALNYFVSDFQEEDNGNKRYNAHIVAFRSDAEHTIGGVRNDLELQIKHTGDTNYAQLSILFDTSDYSETVSESQIEIIDKFFESLNLTENSAEGHWSVDEIPLGQLVSQVDTENRWAYGAKDSVPPCEAEVFYNVLTTIYPIKEDHLALVKAQIALASGVGQNGNYRETQDNFISPTLFFKDRTPPEPETLTNEFQVTLVSLITVILYIWLVVIVGAIIWLGYRFFKNRQNKNQELDEGVAQAQAAQNQEQDFKGYQDGTPKEEAEFQQDNVDTGRNMVN